MTTTKKKGFAAMDPAKVREIAAKGGKAATAKGTRYAFTSEKAREAGTKGGKAPHKSRGGVRKKVPHEIRPIAGEDRIVREPRVAIVPAEEISAEKGLRASDYVEEHGTNNVRVHPES